MLFRSLLLSGACALSSIASAAPLAIELRSDALIDHARIALADIAIVQAEQPLAATLVKLELGQAPRIGYVERLTRAQIEQAIRRHVGVAHSAVAWSGADSVVVRAQSQSVKSSELAAAAVDTLRKQFASADMQLDAAPSVAPADIDVPTGKLELRGRPAPALGARIPLWIDLVVDGAHYRSVVVPLTVTARRAAYVAARDMERGAWATQDDFTVSEISVAGFDAVKVGGQIAPFRLREPLKAGQPLGLAAINVSGKVLRGDQVRLIVRTGQIGIETAAVAMAEAAPGQLITVRPAGGSDIVTGRVGHSGTVTIE